MEAQGVEISAKIIWELEGEKCTKYFFHKIEKRKNTDQAIHSLRSRQNGKILKDQQDQQLAVAKYGRAFFTYFYSM